jgi:hypothetical protein
MSRVARLCAAALALASYLFAGATLAQEGRVSSLEAPALDWPEARRSVEAELRASGFEVLPERSSAVEPSLLLTELESPGEGWAGRVTIVRIGATGIAYVWIPAQRRTYRVLAPPTEPSVAAGMLALRVVELLSLHPTPVERPAEATEVERVAPPAARPPGPAPSAAARSAPPVDGSPEAALGVGAGLGVGVRSPSTKFLMTIDLTLLPPLYVELSGAASVLPATLAFERGSATMQEQQLGAHLVLSTARARGFTAAGGPGMALQCLQLVPEQSAGARATQQHTCVALASARARAGFTFGALGVWAMLEPGLSLPRVRLLRDDETIATLGVWMNASVGLSWQL